jgi:hypothetical protein
MHPDPNEGPTYQAVRTQADLDMFARDLYEGRVINFADMAIRENPGMQYREARPHGLRALFGEGEFPPPTWRPMTDGERDVYREFGREPPPPLTKERPNP